MYSVCMSCKNNLFTQNILRYILYQFVIQLSQPYSIKSNNKYDDFYYKMNRKIIKKNIYIFIETIVFDRLNING